MSDEIKSIRKQITDPYTLELVTESPTEYKQRMRDLLEGDTSKDEIIQEVLHFKRTGVCSFVPNIAGFMVDAGLLGPDHDKYLNMLIEVIEDMK
jgi:hypothetical protein